MARSSAIKSNVDPKTAAIAIVFVLAVVQVIWWRGLVSMNRGKHGFGAQSMQPTRPDPYIQGMPEAQVETLAGAPEPGHKDGIGRNARFDSPSGIAVDRQGGVYVADTRNNKIRYIAPDGRTQTISGREPGYRDGPAEQALFNGPTGLALTADDEVYIADTLNHRIRRIRKGIVETVAGGEPGMVDGPGRSARFNLPAGISLADGGRRLVIADSGNKRVRSLDVASPVGSVTTSAQTTSAPTCAQQAGSGVATTLPDEGAILTGASRSKDVPVELGQYRGVIPDGSIALRNPVTLLPAANGWYAADAAHAAVFLVSNGSARVVAGEAKKSPGPMIGFRDGTGEKAAFGLIAGLASDSSGNLYVADCTNNAIRRIRFGKAAPAGAEEGGRGEWHPGEDYRAPAIRSSQGRDTGKSTGPAGPRYVAPRP